MKEKINTLINSIKKINLDTIACTLLMLWVASPLVEYIFKNYHKKLYTHYFTTAIYIIGFIGIILYAIYIFKLNVKEKQSIKNYIPEILIGTLLAISIIATILSSNPRLSFLGEDYRKEGLFVYIMYIGFVLISSTIKDHKYIKFIVESMIVVCLLITIRPLFNSNFTYVYYDNVFHNFNHYGYYLMINTMLALSMFIDSNALFKKIIYALIYIFFLYLLILNNTFGSYLAIAVTLFFLLVYSIIKKYKLLKVITVITIFVTTSYIISNYNINFGERKNLENAKGIVSENITTLNKDIKAIINNDEKGIKAAGTNRGALWKDAGTYILAHPLVGGGMECLNRYYMYYGNATYNFHYNDRPHNIILQVAAFIGIPGAIVYLALIIYIAISNLVIIKKDSIHIMIYITAMCYFISSMFGNSMYYTSPYFMILLGLLIGYHRTNRLTAS